MPMKIKRTSRPDTSPRRPGLPHVSWLLLLSLLCFPLFHARSESGERPAGAAPIILVPDTLTVVEIAGGSAQVFDISLASRQYLRLSLNKGDLNLSLTLYGPGGQKLLERITRRYETPTMSLIADAAGTYRLDVRSLEQAGAVGQFELRLEPADIATARDAADVAARATVAEAGLLRAQWEEASLLKAATKYTAAWRVWRAAKEWADAADALMDAAEVYLTIGEKSQALELHLTAAAESRRANDGLREAEALAQAGRLYSYLGDNDAAEDYVKRGLNYYSRGGAAEQSPPAKRARAEALRVMGEVSYSKGDLANTAESLQAALRLFSEIGDRGGEARTRLFLGYLSNALGDSEKTLTELNLSLALCRAVGDHMGEALSLTALGVTRSLARDEEGAIKLHREAMQIFRTIGDRQSVAMTLNGVGQAYENLHEYELALESYRLALDIFQSKRSRDFAAGTAYQIAGVFRSTGDTKQALEYYDRCIRLSHAAKKKRTEAYALNDIATIYAAQGERNKALAQYEKVLGFYDSIGDRRGRAVTLNNIGDFFFSLGDKSKALDFYRQALLHGQSTGERGVELSTLYNLARAARDCGDAEEAMARIRQSIEIIEALRSNVASPDFRSSYFAGVHRHYELYIDLLMQLERERPGQGYAADGLRVSESARARALIEILTEARADIRRGVDPAVLQREKELQQLLRAQAQYQMELAGERRPQAEVAEVERGIQQLRAEYEEVQGELRQYNPHLATLIRPEQLSLKEIQAQLRDGDTLLLEYSLGEERSYLWAVTQGSMSSYELPGRATLESAAREVYTLLTARQPVEGKIDAGYQARVEMSDRMYPEKALALSRMLLGPVAEKLRGKRLLVVAEGVLQYIPFEALPWPSTGQGGEGSGERGEADSGGPPQSLEESEIAYQPSMSTLAAIRREQPRASSTGKLIAVLADPVFSRDDERVKGGAELRASAAGPDTDAELGQRAVRSYDGVSGSSGVTRLIHSSEEAEAIEVMASGGSVMVAKGFDASRETAMSPQVGQYQIVHFATHGFINSEHPELSGIVLTMVNRDGGQENGFLQLHDIYNLSLSADLVVLSACDTALGKDVKGEGLVGLTRGFMHAGSRSVVASLWKVDDTATAELMRLFYKGMLQDGLPPSAALRSAKEELRKQKRWRAPYFWAGFVLQGEYREPIHVGGHSRLLAVALILSAAVLITTGFMIFRRRRRRHGLR